jgi:SpoVK/Ycf46/Vps4 family AAA+-type ATPase
MQLQVGSYAIQAHLTHIEPVLATTADSTTRVRACYRVRAQDEGLSLSTFIAEVIRYPDKRFEAAYSTLVGLNAIKKDMQLKLSLILRPGYFEDWLASQYEEQASTVLLGQALRERYPLLLLEGEVGSGKTALARSIGNLLAKSMQSELALFVVNAQVRGSGHVGELTQNISRAFTEAEKCHEREQIPVLLLIDEADALAQTRGGKQTHHEDDAGVNTLIQRIDRLRGRPIAVIFTTNLITSLDSAIVRRATATYHFDRPTPRQRAEVFRRLLEGIGIGDSQIQQLITLTNARILPGFGARTHRYTYSDLTQRIIPHAIEQAIYTQTSLDIEHLISACQAVLPTPETKVE